MRLLLDSHTLLWSFWSSSRLGTQARDAIRSPDNEARTGDAGNILGFQQDIQTH